MEAAASVETNPFPSEEVIIQLCLSSGKIKDIAVSQSATLKCSELLMLFHCNTCHYFFLTRKYLNAFMINILVTHIVNFAMYEITEFPKIPLIVRHPKYLPLPYLLMEMLVGLGGFFTPKIINIAS